jgi:16S rRNA (cytosine967-C5)-methyltransferase
VEPQKRRQELLRDNLNRLNLENVSLFNGTLEEFSQTATHKFQSILVDAPCSGLGVTGRHPDIRWNRKPADLPRFQKIQLEILHNAAELLATRGIIVYATCSMEPEENEEVVKKFLANHPRFKISNAASFLPDQTIKVDKQGYLHTRPSENIQDGFFAVRFTG